MKAINEDVLDDALPEDEEFEEFTDEPEDDADENNDDNDGGDEKEDENEAGVDGNEADVEGVPYDDVDIHHEDDISPEHDEMNIDREHDNVEDDENDGNTAYANELENNKNLKDSYALTLKSENGQGAVKERKNPVKKEPVKEVEKVNDISLL